MKSLKRLGASLLVLVMALAMVVPTMAVDTVTIDTKSNEHSFLVYQVFKADVADGSSLEEGTIDWGDYVSSEKLIEALKAGYPEVFTAETYTAPELAKVLESNFVVPGSKYNSIEKNAELARVIAESGAFSRGVTVTSANSQSVMTGYCVIVDTPNAGDPIYMLRTVTDDLTIDPKDSASQVTKKVWDEDKGADGDWSDGAIYEEGDEIRFKLSVTLPDDILSGKWSNEEGNIGYNLVLHDVQAAGLTFNAGTVQVKLDDKVLAGSTYTVVTEGLTDDCTFEIRINNAQELAGVKAGSVIEVTYTSTLNGDAVTGSEGNSNKIRMTVNDTEVPGEEVKVFELELDVDKVDGDEQPLAGAEFALYNEADVVDGKVVEGATAAYTLIVNETDGSKFSVKGLKAGTYYLVETKAPAGYEGKEITPIKIVITAKTEETPSGAEGGKLIVEINDGIGFTVTEGVIGGTVVNRLGVTLPETGGIGTTIFYIVGGVLAVGAVVLLVTKRRVNSTDDE